MIWDVHPEFRIADPDLFLPGSGLRTQGSKKQWIRDLGSAILVFPSG
jgi:hypothetical protein